MKLTTAMIREAAAGIDALAPEIEVINHLGNAAVRVTRASDLVAFGMSLAYVAGLQAEGKVDGLDVVEAIDDAISTWGRPGGHSLGLGHYFAYWPAVPFEGEVS